MRFFTPGLLADFEQGPETDGYQQACLRWEQAVADYRQHFEHVRAYLPEGATELATGYSLHDREVLGLHATPRALQLVVYKKELPGELLLLSYLLEAPPQVRKGVLDWNILGAGTHLWLYDEFDMLFQNPSSARHQILLSCGWELEILFKDLILTKFEPVGG